MSFPCFEVVFKNMGFRLPFSDFQRDVLRWTKLSPFQVRPNSYAFMRAFELVCQYLGVPSLLSNGEPLGYPSRQNKKMFDLFARKLRSFKERFFLVKLRSEASFNTLLQTVEGESLVRRSFFPLCWSKDHFGYESKDFCRSVSSLTEEEGDACRKLWVFVQSFPREIKTDKCGNPVMDAEGKPVT